jgi:hypothetical protein
MDSRKKKSGSMKMEIKHDIAKNLFHRRTALECGFITGMYGKDDQILLIHPPSWPYRTLSNFKIRENILKPLSSRKSKK